MTAGTRTSRCVTPPSPRSTTARHGVRALVEIHMGTIVPSASAAAQFCSRFDPRHVGVIHDAGNMVFEGFERYRMGLEVLGLSCITNMAAGVLPRPLDHAEVMETARRVRGQFVALLEGIIDRLA